MPRYMIIAFVILVSGCNVKDENKEYLSNLSVDLNSQLEQSLNKWKSIKENNNYQYSTSFTSWVGFGNKTTIYVLNGKVKKRKYRAWDKNGINTDHWTEEDTSSLNSHKHGAPLISMEDIYDECYSILKKKNNEYNHMHLAFDEEGILKQCLYSPKSCADDCSSGFNIHELKFHHQ